MKLMKNLRWAAIALGILGGSTNALACVVSPDSILTEGQTLQLVADCSGGVDGVLGTVKIKTINWKMAVTEGGTPVTITGDITLNQPQAKRVYYTIPAELTSSGSGEYWFSVTGVASDDASISTADKAKVVIKPASAVLSVAQATNPAVNGACGTTPGAALQSMPTGTAQCSTGKAALAISGPASFTWSCLGLNGGAEANCYGVRGYTVTTSAGANGSVSSSQGVAAGGTAIITAFPSTTAYSASFATGTTCPGTASGNTFAASPISTNCTVNATFTNAPQTAACGSASGVATLTAPSTGLCATGTLLGSVASGTGQFTWTCDGPNGGTDASCTAPMQYTVTAALSGTGGTVNAPTSKTVTHNGTTSFSVTPEGTNVASASGCGASVSGNTVTTGAVTGACTVTVSFGAASQCGALPANTTVYTTANREALYIADFDTLFDAATSAYSMDSLIAANKIKSYEFNNDKAFKNGNINNFYSTGQKDMSISACPGDFDVPTACKVMASMGPKVYWSNDGAPYVHPSYSFLTYPTCNIGTGGKFYMNIRSGTTGVSYQIRSEVLNK